MLGKLFGSKKVPTNEGNPGLSQPGESKIIKVFELELSNMEGSPSYSLTHQLTIGSEIGNIIIADPSVSPRHATFILQQDVVSVIDHGSVSGTMVNGKKIPSGRYIILEDSDTVSVGDLNVRINTSNQEVHVDESLESEELAPAAEEIVVEEPVPEPQEEPLVKMVEEDKTPVPSRMSKLISLFKRKPKTPSKKTAPSKTNKLFNIFSKKKPGPSKKGKLELVVSNTNTYSANTLVRVVAVTLDLLLSYTLLVILWPFDEFRKFIEFIPAELANLLGVEWSSLWESFTQDYEFIRELATDAYGFVSGHVHIGPLLLIFLLVRFVTTLFLGVSISEFLLSIGAMGNKIWARIGGMIRVLVGAVTGPFLIFDVPAIVSRRTLKEFITFTNIQVRSKFIAVLASILLIPLFVALSLMAPLIQGFDPPESIIVNDTLERRVKVQKTTEGTEEQRTPIKEASKFLQLQLDYVTEDLLLIPNIKFQGVQNKLNYRSQLIFYHRELQRPVTVELIKKFDLQQLLAIGIKGNFFLYEKFPELYSYVYQADSSIPFKVVSDEKAQTRFANEFMVYTKLAFGLSLENAFEVMELETPFLKGFMDFRSSLLGLLEYKDFTEIGFIKLGNAIFLKVSYNAQKPFDIIVPLLKGEGRVFKVDYDKKENLSVLASKFYKYSLDKTNWLGSQKSQESETLSALQVMDLLATLDPVKKKIQPERAQALYGYYFERSSEIFKRDDTFEYELWKKSLASIVRVIENLQESKTQVEDSEDPVRKLKQNFRDLMEAVESKNLTYFGLTDTQTI